MTILIKYSRLYIVKLEILEKGLGKNGQFTCLVQVGFSPFFLEYVFFFFFFFFFQTYLEFING